VEEFGDRTMNARKARERHRMEQEHQAEQDKLQEMYDNYEVFSCSGSMRHLPDCDGNCEVLALTGHDRLIAEEGRKWDELNMAAVGAVPGMPMPGIPVNTFDLENKVQVLINMLIEKGVATKEELDNAYAEFKYERMKATREANEDAIREAQRRAAIAVPGADLRPKIILPDHTKVRMQ